MNTSNATLRRTLAVGAFALLGTLAATGAHADETMSATASGTTDSATVSTSSDGTATATSTGTADTSGTASQGTVTTSSSTGMTAVGTGSSNSGSVKPVKAPKNSGGKDFSCVRPLVQTRETALSAAWDKEFTAVKAALDARKAALDAAWSQTDRKKVDKAVNAAHKAYTKAVKAAHKLGAKERRDAWNAYRKATKSCKIERGNDSVESASEKSDSQD